MPFEQPKPAEHNQPADRLEVYAPIAANSWNQNDLRALSTNTESVLPAAFGSFQVTQNVETQSFSVLDIQKNSPDYKLQVKEYFANQAQRCELLADEQKAQSKPENESTNVEPNQEQEPSQNAQPKPAENSAPSTEQAKAPEPVLIAKVDATLERKTGKLTIIEMDGNAKHKQGEKLTVDAHSGNGECSIPHGQGADGRYDNATDRGPIPKGDYMIGKMYKNKDIAEEYPTGDAMWYKLYGSDGKGGFDYNKMWNDRGVFNLHTGDRSNGCVGIPSDVKEPNPGYPHSKNYDKVKDLINNSKPFEYKPGDEMQGWLHVK